jgi:hypothetical protein
MRCVKVEHSEKRGRGENMGKHLKGAIYRKMKRSVLIFGIAKLIDLDGANLTTVTIFPAQRDGTSGKTRPVYTKVSLYEFIPYNPYRCQYAG